MADRDRLVSRARRRAEHDRASIGEEIRTARVMAGRTQRSVGGAAGMSRSQVGRIELGRLPSVSIDQLGRLCGVVGLDLRVRAYPGGPPLRDAGHAALLGRLRSRVHPSLRLDLEVALPMIGDPRAWDGMIVGGGGRTAVEAETRLYDIQALLRRIRLKSRDDETDRVLLVLADSKRNREAVRATESLLREAFPVSGRSALAALGAGIHPSGSAFVFL